MKKTDYVHLIHAAALTIAVTIAAGTLTGCSNSKTSTHYMEETLVESTAAMPATAASTYDNMEIAAEYGSGAAPSDTGLTSSAAIHPVPSSRKLIRTVNLVVETTEFDALIDALTQSINTSGGYLESSEIYGNSISSSTKYNRHASLIARVPSDKLDIFVAQVDQNGNITNKSEDTQDVTLQYADIESRKKTLSVEQDRLWELLAKAESIESVIALESRLSEIRYQLESMESQLRTYDNQVDYSTIYLNINEVQSFTSTYPDPVATRIQKGFNRNLNRIRNSAVDFTVWFLSGLPILLVYAAFIGIFVIIVHALVKRYQKHRKKHQETVMTKEEGIIPPTKDL